VQCGNQEKNQLFIGNDLKWNAHLPERVINDTRNGYTLSDLFFRWLGAKGTLKIKGKF
jgi:hypothetical protein